MPAHEALLKMRKWITSELQKAQRPFADSFTLLSLSFCAEKALGAAVAPDVLMRLRAVASVERQVGTYDVVSPYGAIFLINRALKTLD